MNKTTLTLYDFLNYEMIGALMLLACNIKPNTISSWFYFILAYIVGLIIVKLNENTIWSSIFRNSECIIKDAECTLKSTKGKPVLNEYYRNYYSVFGEKVNDNIRILEAQVAFIWNLVIPVFIYGTMFVLRGNEFVFTIFNSNTITSCNNCCYFLHVNQHCVHMCICPIVLAIIVLSFGILIRYIKDQCCQCYKYKREKRENLKEYEKKFCWLVCGLLILCIFEAVLLFRIYLPAYFSSGNLSLTEQRIGAALGLLLLLLPYIAYCIQKKISTLVVEGAHYLQKQTN